MFAERSGKINSHKTLKIKKRNLSSLRRTKEEVVRNRYAQPFTENGI